MTTSHSTTSDGIAIQEFSLACYLWFRGHELTAMDWRHDDRERPQCVWTFAYAKRLQKDMDAFGRGHAVVDPAVYFGKVTDFKRMTYESRPTV